MKCPFTALGDHKHCVNTAGLPSISEGGGQEAGREGVTPEMESAQ